ncbi:MAG: ATP-dependent DNA helicase [Clostridium sp.]|nr:ATP-dependent DNA helicase [Clostridium sp.]
MKISVRNLVEFVLRSGDIDNRRTSGAQKEAMQEGTRIHRKIQRQQGPSYRAEVFLRHQVEEDGFFLIIEGRADGIIEEPSGVTIDEIKGVYLDLDEMKEPNPVHLAQAMCYAWFYVYENKLSEAAVQMTYCSLETEEIRRFRIVKSAQELECWFQGLLHEYMKWARYLYHNAVRRDESLRELQFPFPYRNGQRDLAVSVYRTVSRGKKLFIQAPTGIGKTLSTIFPSLKAVGEGYGEKLFYLTAKTITRSVAEETLELLRDRGLYFRSVTITAKEKLCFLEKPECNPDACPYAKGHFDRVNDAVYTVLHQEFGIVREKILAYAEQFHVCPFELCLDISSFVDGIICDYNYVFDPDVRLKRYFAEGQRGDYIFLIDEAHNLAGRAREMYSASIVKEKFLEIKKLVKEVSPRLTRYLNRVNRLLLEMKRECRGMEILSDAGSLAMALSQMFSELEKFLDQYREFKDRELILELYFSVRSFLNTYERMDEHYRIYSRLLENGDFCVKLLCVNPIQNLAECLAQGKAAVFFSATMLPIRYYRELLSNEPEDYAVYVNSPFPEKNRAILVSSDISSRYTRRNRREFEKAADYIEEIASAKMGNYMVFFPSYQYMEAVREILLERNSELFLLVQKSRMTEADREAFLEEFSLKRQKSLAALCVMGGVFSEGIDLTGDKLIGVIIIGTGIPQVNPEQEILKQYFEENGGNGFDYAYRYPGMNKVLQAAGRVIRTMEDRGIIALLDDRFLQQEYQELFPREWREYFIVTRRSVRQAAQAFWNSSDSYTEKKRQ